MMRDVFESQYTRSATIVAEIDKIGLECWMAIEEEPEAMPV